MKSAERFPLIKAALRLPQGFPNVFPFFVHGFFYQRFVVVVIVLGFVKVGIPAPHL
jgi:hypothetical protein